MKKLLPLILFLLFSFESFSNEKNRPVFHPVEHASFVIESNGLTIFVDPVGKPEVYKAYSTPQLILITHTHGDHFDAELLKNFNTEKTIIIGPQRVIEKLGFGTIMKNGETKTPMLDVVVDAIPMYNLTAERSQFHPKGTGNGYVITIDNERIYVAGDTEEIPEMLSLKNIDYAFICMNLPYTMTVEQAASAVLKFQPKIVFPYHYRQKDGFNDIETFKKLVSVNKKIKVEFLKWY